MDNKQTPKNFIIKLKSGEEKAFEYLFKEFYPKLTIFAKKYVNDLDIAREIVQDFFVKLYENRASLNIKTSLKAYLYKSVHNRCLNYLKHVQIREKHHERLRIEKVDSQICYSDKILETELEHKIYQAISELPAQCQKIFKLNRFNGLKNKEIAEQLNISKRTVETQISKALRLLRSKLLEYLSILFSLIFWLN